MQRNKIITNKKLLSNSQQTIKYQQKSSEKSLKENKSDLNDQSQGNKEETVQSTDKDPLLDGNIKQNIPKHNEGAGVVNGVNNTDRQIRLNNAAENSVSKYKDFIENKKTFTEISSEQLTAIIDGKIRETLKSDE
jgi:hypothetical protein